jgi:hypothetical protein
VTVSITTRVEMDFGAGWVDVSEDVVTGVEAEWGLDGSTPKDRCAGPGSLRFGLDNSNLNSGGLAGYYTPGHADVRSGFALGIPVRLVFDCAALTIADRVKWQGTVANITPGIGARGGQVTTIECVDWMAEAERSKLGGLPVMVDATADEVFAVIVGAMSAQPPNGTVVDVGSDTYPFALDNTRDERVSVLTELQKLALSEYGQVYVQAGELVFENRSRRRLGADPVLEDFFALDEDDNLIALEVSHSRENVLNRFQVAAHPRRRDDDATTVLFTLRGAINVPAGQTVRITCQYRDPNQVSQRVGGIDMVTPVATTDYTFNALKDGSGTDLTADLTVTYVGTPGGNAAIVDLENTGASSGWVPAGGLQLRGRGLYDFEPVVSDLSDATSIGDYGENELSYDMPYQSEPANAVALAELLLEQNKDALTRVDSATFIAQWSEAEAEAFLEQTISTGVKVNAPSANVEDELFWINGVRLQIGVSGLIHVTWRLAPIYTAENWLLGEAGFSELGETTILGAF